MKPVLLYAIPLWLFSQSTPLPIELSKSTIILPIEANLTQLETYLNHTIPDTLSEINDIDKICVKPQYLKTKGIPKCRMDNLKISCKAQWIKIQTIPEIKCDIIGWVKRDGNITISGEKNRLTFAFPIKTKITTKSHIDSTATAAAVIYMNAIPRIHNDWSLKLDVNSTFTWSKKPTLTLRNGIEITIQNSVETRLQKRLDKLIKKIPKRLEKLHLKEKVNVAWKKIQDPIKLDKHSQTYLLFKPQVLSYSGFRIVQDILSTTLSINGETDIIIGTPPQNIKKVALGNLENIPFQEGKFNFFLPISMTYKEIIELLNTKFKEGYTIDFTQSTLPGIITLSHPTIEKTDTDTLKITAQLQYDNHTTWLSNIQGKITFEGRPKIDKKNKTIILENLTYTTKTNSEIFDSLVNIAEIKPLNLYLTHLMQFRFGKKIEKAIQKANKALKHIAQKSIKLSAKLEVASVENLIIDEKKITLYTKASGVVKATIDLKPN
jgi:hypothetical protein